MPIYGFGAILIIQSSNWTSIIFENHFMSLFITLLFSTLLVTVLEFITGFLLEKVFNSKWWDYNNNIMNFKRYIYLTTLFYRAY